MRNPEIEHAAQILLSFLDTEDMDVHLDAAGDIHMEGDAGNSNDIIEAFLRSASRPVAE